jgi:arylsulfatase A-like enzyme
MKTSLAITLTLVLLSIQSASCIEKPNIVFILADDQGYGDLGSYGSEVIHTPNIDRLAEEGMKFESFYVHNRCSPTRAAFMTGCHAQRVDLGKVIYRRDLSGINSEEITIAELLKEAGYATGIIGKWHLGEWPQFNPLHHGFDYFYGLMDDGGNGRSIFENHEKIADIDHQNDHYSTLRFQPASIRFIRRHKDQPFFLYYASNIPHSKWIPLASFEGSSKQGAYGDCVQQLDWVVGELLKELDALGLSENTLVIYASDNGPQLNLDGHGSAGVLRDGKWTNFEGGIRVPCIMRWPGRIPAGSTNDEITGIIDMLPTFCEIAGAEVPSDRIIDGRNILPYMLNQVLEEPIHKTFIVPGATIRHGDWKLLVKDQKPGGNDKGQGDTTRTSARAGSMFNLRMDPGEKKDLSGQYPEIADNLDQMMKAYMDTFNENIRPREYIKK